MKKQISPVVTVIVILVVVAVVALLWTHFSAPGKERAGGRGGFGFNVSGGDLSKVNPADLQKAREAAAAAKNKLNEQRQSGRAPGT